MQENVRNISTDRELPCTGQKSLITGDIRSGYLTTRERSKTNEHLAGKPGPDFFLCDAAMRNHGYFRSAKSKLRLREKSIGDASNLGDLVPGYPRDS
jgi:hypothetical protein